MDGEQDQAFGAGADAAEQLPDGQIDAGAGEQPGKADIEAQARAQGWSPEKGSLTAEEFVARGEQFAGVQKRIAENLRAEMATERKATEDKIERLERMNEVALKRQREQYEAQISGLSQAKRAAVEAGDVDTYARLDKEEDALRKSPPPEMPAEHEPKAADQRSMHPETQEFLRRHAWLREDEVAMAAAVAAAGQAAKRGVSDITGQLHAAEQEIRQMRPSRFSKPPSPEGGGAQRPGKRPKGEADLPSDARRQGERMIRDGIYKDMAEYAADFWSAK